MKETISFLKAYGIDKANTDLLYKHLPSGKYIVAYIKYDIDVFLCTYLPKTHEYINSDCVIDEILGFRDDNKEKLEHFKTMLTK